MIEHFFNELEKISSFPRSLPMKTTPPPFGMTKGSVNGVFQKSPVNVSSTPVKVAGSNVDISKKDSVAYGKPV